MARRTPAPLVAPPADALLSTLGHLLRLSDGVGLHEHARLAVPRREHGYCVDDNARAVIVLSALPAGRMTTDTRHLRDRCLRFVLEAQAPDGRFFNRFSSKRRWTDASGTADHWGRALWALGQFAHGERRHPLAPAARSSFLAGARHRSPYPRAIAYAALGAADFCNVTADPTERSVVRALLQEAVAVIGRPSPDPGWPWPEPRLTYANARLPEALIAVGAALHEPAVVHDGVRLLRWLAATETRDGRLSLTPVGGWGRGEPRPGFDQQPIEAWALADAALRALAVTGADGWRTVIARCGAWFLGDNDSQTPLRNEVTGGGCDGLEAGGRNQNQGAESTLALAAVLAACAEGCKPALPAR